MHFCMVSSSIVWIFEVVVEVMVVVRILYRSGLDNGFVWLLLLISLSQGRASYIPTGHVGPPAPAYIPMAP